MRLSRSGEAILLTGARQVEDGEARDRYFARAADVLRPIYEIRGWAFLAEVRAAVDAGLADAGRCAR